MFRLSCGLLLMAGLTAVPAREKTTVPGDMDQEAIRLRLRSVFKTEYAKTSPSAVLAFADKLIASAAEEKDNPSARYVMLTEAGTLALRFGDLERATLVAREIDRNFEAPNLGDWLGNGFSESIGGKQRIDEFRVIAKSEIAQPTEGKDRVLLGHLWIDVARFVRPDLKFHSLRRGQFWLRQALDAQQIKGLERTELEQQVKDISTEIERTDAKLNRFNMYQGNWKVKYHHNYVHEYVITADGAIMFDRGFTPDGKVFVKKAESRAKLVRRDNVVLVYFNNGAVVERFTLDRDKLLIDRFDPGKNYPKGMIHISGEGFRE